MAVEHGAGYLIVIAGGIGSGKSTIASAVSERLDIPVHSIDDDKRRLGAEEADFDGWVSNGIPFPDDFRAKVFDLTLTRLAVLAQQHRMVIVEETFHRAALRESFFKAARQTFGGLCLVEVAVRSDVAISHLEQRAKQDGEHLAGRAMFEAFNKLADPLTGVDLTVENNGNLDCAVDEVCHHVVSSLQ